MKQDHSRWLDLKKIRVLEGFWKRKMELVRTEVIPYQWRALNDEIKEAEPSYCMRNYRIAGKLIRGETERKLKKEMAFQPLPETPDKLEDTFYGFAFQDSDFAKWIEAAAYSLTQYPDRQLEQIADAAIDVVCAAQQEDGYLDTYFIIRNPAAIFSNLRDYHELYCFGHLAEGAVAYYQATGKRKLLEAVERYAAYIEKRIGSEKGKIHGYPGHEEAELALVKLYDVTGDDRYLKLAKYFVDARGRQPYYFDQEHPDEVTQENHSVEEIDFAGKKKTEEERYQYSQAHRPVRQQSEAVGHAVRAVYLYSGMVDVARLTEDTELFQACETLWDNITNKKMYVTGSIGGTHVGEAFSHEYDLPGDTAYAETCAAIGLVFFAGRMLQYSSKGKYADVMERVLYNGVLSGMALDGRSFFYVNPLECRPQDCGKDARKQHVKPIRQKWFGCACCPPNLARLISSIGMYAFTETGNTFYIHFLLNAVAEKEIIGINGEEKKIQITMQGNLPWDGRGSIRISGLEEGELVRLAVRVPEWTGTFSINGRTCQNVIQWRETGGEEKDGYLYLEIQKDSEIALEFTMPVRYIHANPKVRETAGQLTVMRGPVVYCLEEKDNGADLHLLRVDTSKQPEVTEGEICGEQVMLIRTAGIREQCAEEGGLYRSGEGEKEAPVTLQWVPYYTWANRGENEMRVWVRR